VELFFSYSHQDEGLRNELEKHLSVLRRQGVIDIWTDHRIGPGEEIGGEIDRHLESADIILLLVSSDFLNSNYCIDIELKRAMERHERGEARVVPVILRPCDWQSAPFGGLKALPADGKPVTKHQSLDDAFVEVARAIREIAQQLKPAPAVTEHVEPAVERPATQQVRSSNLRVRQEFTDRQRHKFLDDAFEYIAQYFEGSLTELEARNPDVETNFKRVDANRFEAVAYMSGQERSRCGIWLGDNASILKGILYSHSGLGSGNSYNESLSLEDDGFSLFLKPMGMASMGQGKDKLLTPEGAAEFYWSLFIERMQ
jgi:TIR domain